MTHLTIDTFLYVNDFELGQYKVLGALKLYKEEFNKNQVFPVLSELTTLVNTLIRVEKKRSKIIDLFPIPVEQVDAENKRLVFENFVLYNEDIERIFDLIKWAIPVIHDTIDEGLCITKSFKKEQVAELV
ncbi:MAG: hypothetical protein ACM3S2_14260 [Ignavibacteriales bacterium]